MAFNSTINTGTSPNDGQGDGLRTNLRKLIENDNHLKEQNTQFQQIVANVLRSTKGVVNISNSFFTTAFTVSGDRLSAGIRVSICGTGDGVVVNVVLDILVNHSQDILVKSISGFFTQLEVKVVSNNNEDFAILLKHNNHATTNVDMAIEVFPLSSETITFTGTHNYSGSELLHKTKRGMYISGTGGGNGDIETEGNLTCTSLIQTSDKKFKSNIELIDGVWALDVFKKLNFSFYDFSKTNSKQAGLIAQEVEKILPQAVHTSENGEKGLNHTYIDMVCKAAIQHFIKTQIQ